MNRILWSRILAVAGLAGMLIGALDPLEGCVVILGGAVLAALGAFVSQARSRKALYMALCLVAFGVAAMFAATVAGGIGGRSGHSIWWGLFMIPYPVGWIVGLVGEILTIREVFRRPATPQ